MLIKITDIETDGQLVREEVDPDHVTELAMSIATHGLLQPIAVRENGGEKYQLLAGRHRLEACRKLHLSEIEANVMTDSIAPVKALASVENILRKNMTLWEEVDAVIYLHETDKRSPAEIADIIGKSRDWVLKRMMVPGLPEELRDELYADRISIRQAECIARITDPGVRGLVLNQSIAGKLTARQTEELTGLYLETPSMESAVAAGAEKAAQVCAQKTPMRRCDTCGVERRLIDIQFMGVCSDGCKPVRPEDEKGEEK